MVAGGENSVMDKGRTNAESDFKVCVYPPGPVKKLNVAIATDESEDKEKIKEMVSNSVGLDYNRGDSINILNKNVKNESVSMNEQRVNNIVPVETVVATESKTPLYGHIFGAVSLIIAGIFLFLGVRNILRNERYDS
jgi:flagellar biosynthesis/type III secretory pathway M-ring protein FliF/YscJ